MEYRVSANSGSGGSAERLRRSRVAPLSREVRRRDAVINRGRFLLKFDICLEFRGKYCSSSIVSVSIDSEVRSDAP